MYAILCLILVSVENVMEHAIKVLEEALEEATMLYETFYTKVDEYPLSVAYNNRLLYFKAQKEQLEQAIQILAY